MKKNKTTIILAVVLVLVIALAATAYLLTRPKTQLGAKTITIVVVQDGQQDKTFTLHTDKEFLEEALLEEGLISGDESEFGMMIHTVDGTKANTENQEWWCITKGGQEVVLGASELAIADGEQYELTLTVGW